jgi:hypothetical protein
MPEGFWRAKLVECSLTRVHWLRLHNSESNDSVRSECESKVSRLRHLGSKGSRESLTCLRDRPAGNVDVFRKSLKRRCIRFCGTIAVDPAISHDDRSTRRLQYLWRKHPLTTTYYHPPRSTSTPHTLTDCHHSQFSKALRFSLFLFCAATTKSDFRRIAEAPLIPPWIPHLALYVIKPLYVLSVTRYRVYSADYDPR